MYRVVDANPAGRIVKAQRHSDNSIFHMACSEIYKHLGMQNITCGDLDAVIPKAGYPWHFLGMYLGMSLFLDDTGKFQFEDQLQPEPVFEEEDKCDHSFLVTDRDDKGNVFWCKVCDDRFVEDPTNKTAQPNTMSMVLDPLVDIDIATLALDLYNKKMGALDIMEEYKNGEITYDAFRNVYTNEVM